LRLHLEDILDHFVLTRGRPAPLRATARVNDAVHIQVEVVELNFVGVRLGSVDIYFYAVYFDLQRVGVMTMKKVERLLSVQLSAFS
jgi:hypothetical protein